MCVSTWAKWWNTQHTRSIHNSCWEIYIVTKRTFIRPHVKHRINFKNPRVWTVWLDLNPIHRLRRWIFAVWNTSNEWDCNRLHYINHMHEYTCKANIQTPHTHTPYTGILFILSFTHSLIWFIPMPPLAIIICALVCATLLMAFYNCVTVLQHCRYIRLPFDGRKMPIRSERETRDRMNGAN